MSSPLHKDTVCTHPWDGYCPGWGNGSEPKSQLARRPQVVQQMSDDPSDMRVKGICAFTRSLGDLQLKHKGVAMLHNMQHAREIQPLPGALVSRTVADWVPEHTRARARGFLLARQDFVFTIQNALRIFFV